MSLVLVRFPPMLALLTITGIAQGQTLPSVDVYELQNKAELKDNDMAYLNDVIQSGLMQIPKAQLSVSCVSIPSADACSTDLETCLTQDAVSRGRVFLVYSVVSPVGTGFGLMLKLVEVESGQLLAAVSSRSHEALDSLLEEVRSLVDSITQALEQKIEKDAAQSQPAPQPSESPQEAQTSKAPSESSETAGTLRVVTEPPGASIYIYRDGVSEHVGSSPVEKVLAPNPYIVKAIHPHHKEAEVRIRIDPREVEELKLVLKNKANPYKVGGHLLVWSGLGFIGLGAAATVLSKINCDSYSESADKEDRDDSRVWAGTMWAGYAVGLCMVTSGIVMLIRAPSNEEYYQRKIALDGLGLRGRF